MGSPSELYSVRIVGGARYYVCMVCGRRYLSRSGVRQHVRSRHGDILGST